MAKVNARIIEEARRRASTQRFTLADYCFDKQLAFINDPLRFKTAVCSRRAGKTVSCAADLVHTATHFEGDVAYITLNRITAKKIIWRELLSIIKKYKITAKVDNAELSITIPFGDRENVIYVSGAKDESEIEKFRGMKFRKVYIDECQSFRSYIKALVEDIIEPALTDYNGSLILIGTPGPVPGGYFYDASQSKGWGKHHWTMADNPFIKKQSGRDPIDIIKELAERRGLTISDPSIQREYFGQWIRDENSRVYKFNPDKNIIHLLPDNLEYIFGIDIGYNDADAIAVLGYNYETKCVYLIEEIITPKQDITSLVGQIKILRDKFNPIKMVMDAGALGKKIQEEILSRHSLPLEAAEKQRKHEFIALLNGDLGASMFKALPNTRFEEDSMKVTWDYDDPQKPRISDAVHTDIGDAVLYAWRAARHYLAEARVVPQARTAEEQVDAFWAAQEELLERKHSDIDDIRGSQEDADSLFED